MNTVARWLVGLGLTLALAMGAAWIAAMGRLTAVEVSIREMDRNITQQLVQLRILTEAHIAMPSHREGGEQIRQLQRSSSELASRLATIEAQIIKPRP